MQTLLRSPGRWLAAFARARSGLAAVEFALVLPVMLVLYFGMAEVTSAVSADRKLTLLSRTLADLVARGTTITSPEMDAIFAASSAVMHPNPTAELGMTVASIRVRAENANEGVVCWREARGKSPPAIADRVEVPDGFRNPNTHYVMVRTAYAYQPRIGYVLTGNVTLSEDTPWPVRNGDAVRRTGGSGTGECSASVS